MKEILVLKIELDESDKLHPKVHATLNHHCDCIDGALDTIQTFVDMKRKNLKKADA